MLIRNAIVLIDQIDRKVSTKGKPPFPGGGGIRQAGPTGPHGGPHHRVDVVPLSFDVLSSAMAVAIMFGLTFATVLTLVVVPVLYAVLFRIPAKS